MENTHAGEMEEERHLVISEEELDGLLPLYPVCSIYRVPERLRRVNEKAYTPQVVSIGPFHHGSHHLKGMEEQKKRYLRAFLGRTRVSLDICINKIRMEEAQLRSSYAETIEFSSDDFVRIILVDAAFIIEVLLRSHLHEFPQADDRIFNRPWMLQYVWPDMLLLENQLPFFILENLFDLVISRNDDASGSVDDILPMPSLIHLSHKFFKSILQTEAMEGNLQMTCSSKVEHFVDLCRSLYLPLPLNVELSHQTTTPHLPSVRELHHAGVKFKVSSTKNLADIQFTGGILEIPKLTLSEGLELTLRNLLAFEQRHYTQNIFNDYVVLIARLVNTFEDVELLADFGVLENRVGNSSAAAILINNLAEGVLADPGHFYYGTILQDLNLYCRTPWHRCKKYLMQHFFHTPWATKEIIAAVLFFVLSLIQTMFSIMSYCHDLNSSKSK